MRPPDEYRHITAAEAQAYWGIPAGTVWSWASRRKLLAIAQEPDGTRWYRLADVLRLAARRRPRR